MTPHLGSIEDADHKWCDSPDCWCNAMTERYKHWREMIDDLKRHADASALIYEVLIREINMEAKVFATTPVETEPDSRSQEERCETLKKVIDKI